MKVPRGATEQNERLRGYILKRKNKNSWMGYSREIKRGNSSKCWGVGAMG